jgi:signal transduction histidine kinase
MKSYSYLDQGVQQDVDIHQGLEDTIRLFSYKLKSGIEVQRHYDQQLSKIPAYGSELNQVWTNLIDNAIDAMNSEEHPKKQILEIRTQRQANHARIEIIDNGPGIPCEIQSRLYEPFFTTKPVGQGSGLGLETVRRIVENRHQGTITFDSHPGRTCFTVCLPLV